MTNFLNFNHFETTQAELCLKGTFVKASFIFVTIFLDIYENYRGKKTLLTLCVGHT